MGGAVGWPPSEIRAASFAEIIAAWVGFARVQGWLESGPDRSREAEDDLDALMARYPDVKPPSQASA